MQRYQPYFESIGVDKFSHLYSRNKKAILIPGAGAAVDTQKPSEAVSLFSSAIQKAIPGIPLDPNNMKAGRFGFSDSWEFDPTMAGSGHPGHWKSDSRGYFCALKNTIFFFPKSDYAFESDLVPGTKLTWWQHLQRSLGLKSLTEN